jgi:hypothetical protein
VVKLIIDVLKLAVGAPLVDSILQALQAYQGTPIPNATGSGSTQA